MAERAYLNTVTQIGVESVAGTAVAANRWLQSTQILPRPQGNIDRFAPMGYKFDTFSAPGKEWTEADISGFASYTDLMYLLSSLIEVPTSTRNIPSTGLSYRHLFSPATAAMDTTNTFTVEQGSSVRAHRFAYGLVNELELSWDRETVEISGAMMGRAIEDAVTLTASPTQISAVPILPKQISVYLDNSSAALGTTKLTRVVAGSFRYADRFRQLWVVDAAQSSYVAHYEIKPEVRASLTLEADATGMALLTTMRAAGQKWLRVQAIGDVIETIYAYNMTLDAPVRIVELPPFADSDGLFTVEWVMSPQHDATWGQAFQIEITNAFSGAT